MTLEDKRKIHIRVFGPLEKDPVRRAACIKEECLIIYEEMIVKMNLISKSYDIPIDLILKEIQLLENR